MKSALLCDGGRTTRIPVEQWTLYGDIAEIEANRTVLGVDIADIGVLPPPGCYLGTMACGESAPAPARFVVTARPEGDTIGWHRRITVEAEPDESLTLRSRLALVFEAMLAVPGVSGPESFVDVVPNAWDAAAAATEE